jgi:hypothetical protein
MLYELQLQLQRHDLVVTTTTRTVLGHTLRSAARMLRDDGTSAALRRTLVRVRRSIGVERRP